METNITIQFVNVLWPDTNKNCIIDRKVQGQHELSKECHYLLGTVGFYLKFFSFALREKRGGGGWSLGKQKTWGKTWGKHAGGGCLVNLTWGKPWLREVRICERLRESAGDWVHLRKFERISVRFFESVRDYTSFFNLRFNLRKIEGGKG